jgi:hypothetical protein
VNSYYVNVINLNFCIKISNRQAEEMLFIGYCIQLKMHNKTYKMEVWKQLNTIKGIECVWAERAEETIWIKDIYSEKREGRITE